MKRINIIDILIYVAVALVIMVITVKFFCIEEPVYTTRTGECYHFCGCETLDDARESSDYVKYDSIDDVPSFYSRCGVCNPKKRLTFGRNEHNIALFKLWVNKNITHRNEVPYCVVGTFLSQEYFDNKYGTWEKFYCWEENDRYYTYYLVHIEGEPVDVAESLYVDGADITDAQKNGEYYTYDVKNIGGEIVTVSIKYSAGNTDKIIIDMEGYKTIELYRLDEK